jgi:hypothetical protein
MSEHNAISLNCNTTNTQIFSEKCHSSRKDSFTMENIDMSTQFLTPYIMIIMADESFLLHKNPMKIFCDGISSPNTVCPSPFDQTATSSRMFIRNVE